MSAWTALWEYYRDIFPWIIREHMWLMTGYTLAAMAVVVIIEYLAGRLWNAKWGKAGYWGFRLLIRAGGWVCVIPCFLFFKGMPQAKSTIDEWRDNPERIYEQTQNPDRLKPKGETAQKIKRKAINEILNTGRADETKQDESIVIYLAQSMAEPADLFIRPNRYMLNDIALPFDWEKAPQDVCDYWQDKMAATAITYFELDQMRQYEQVYQDVALQNWEKRIGQYLMMRQHLEMICTVEKPYMAQAAEKMPVYIAWILAGLSVFVMYKPCADIRPNKPRRLFRRHF